MTNKSSRWSTEPFLLRPAAKDYLWGGRRLNDDFGKDIPLSPLAETWECSTHPDGPSTVASGPMAGRTLSALLRQAPGLLGARPGPDGGLPILIKFIDAARDLSVQVHPDDAYAREHENVPNGKTELWYVLDAAPGASLIYGFSRDMTARAVRRAVEQGTVERCLQRVPVHKDDVFFIPAGTVHAIGAGALIAEIQQSSNLTYRMYDYGRTDRSGRRRPLHLDKALAVADLHARPLPRQPLRVLRYRPGCASELLCRCRYFQVERLLINTARCRSMARLAAEPDRFAVLLCVDGCGTLFWGQGSALRFCKGDCVFVPAGAPPLHLHGQAVLLRVTC